MATAYVTLSPEPPPPPPRSVESVTLTLTLDEAALLLRYLGVASIHSMQEQLALAMDRRGLVRALAAAHRDGGHSIYKALAVIGPYL